MKDSIDKLICAACESTDLTIDKSVRAKRVLDIAAQANAIRARLATLERVAEAAKRLNFYGEALAAFTIHPDEDHEEAEQRKEMLEYELEKCWPALRDALAALSTLQPDSAKDMFETAVDVKAGLSPERGMAEQAAYEQAISDQATFAALVEVARAAERVRDKREHLDPLRNHGYSCSSKNPDNDCDCGKWDFDMVMDGLGCALTRLRALNPKLLEDGR